MVIHVTNLTMPGWNSAVMHFGDGFYVNFTLDCDDPFLDNYSFSIDAKWQDSSYTQHMHNIHSEQRGLSFWYPGSSAAISLECDASYSCSGTYCGGGFDFPDNERPGRNTPVFIYLTINNAHTNETITQYIGMTYTPDIIDGYPNIVVQQIPAEVMVSDTIYFDAGVVAVGGPVTNPTFGMRLVSGPAPKYWSNGSWHAVTADFYYWPFGTMVIPAENQATTTVALQLPSDGNKTMTLEFVAARFDANGNPAQYGTPIQRTTYIKTNIVKTCTEASTRCVNADGTPGGCVRQVCSNNAWLTTNQNDITCDGCNQNKPCGSTPHGTLGCGHPDICTQYKCDNGVWDVYLSNTANCGTNCAPCPTENATYCDGCKQYKCTGGKWLLSDGNAKSCGSTCGGGGTLGGNTLLYVGAGVAVIAGVAAYMIYKSRNNRKYIE